jgi:hypothetical protein
MIEHDRLTVFSAKLEIMSNKGTFHRHPVRLDSQAMVHCEFDRKTETWIASIIKNSSSERTIGSVHDESPELAILNVIKTFYTEGR